MAAIARPLAQPDDSVSPGVTQSRLETILKVVAGVHNSVDERFALVQEAIDQVTDIGQVKVAVSEEVRDVVQEQLKVTVQGEIAHAIGEEVKRTVQQRASEVVCREVTQVVQQVDLCMGFLLP
ncbi:hypothetical protein N7481_001275 [Penicillium waksmanii]|uniref:uncharacterized protein n=1 Tax=Penicillium waksmanii TaxID=69791 RepID=UPI002546BD56|nr:uncharacterized protein N7481_001275 [Penicillium waksmanii]KAJ6000866.1 hypothetical protein N7481_001275 [Penicillium waksmanii]